MEIFKKPGFVKEALGNLPDLTSGADVEIEAVFQL
jgi:hypothetical protein